MTRFARAQGSKASNARTPEEATSWAEMKRQLTQKQQDIEEIEKRKEADKVRIKNYRKFLDEEQEKQPNNLWAEFPAACIEKRRKADDNLNDNNVALFTPDPDENRRKKKLAKHTKKELWDNEDGTVKNTQKDKSNEEIGVHFRNNKKVSKKNGQNITTTKISPNVEMISHEGTIKENKLNANYTLKNDNQETIKQNTLIVAKSKNKVKKRKINLKDTKRIEKNIEKVLVNGQNVPIVLYEGFRILKDDADRLRSLHKQMVSKGLPSSEIKTALKLERRRAEKYLSRVKKNVCFNCRQSGHNLVDCPSLQNRDSMMTGVCFKCGSTEHTHFECRVVQSQEFRFASCFICKEQGHIARQCPDNARGLYPKGGACKMCGDVTHLKKDCPRYMAEQEATTINLDRIGNDNIEGLEPKSDNTVIHRNVNKIVKF